MMMSFNDWIIIKERQNMIFGGYFERRGDMKDSYESEELWGGCYCPKCQYINWINDLIDGNDGCIHCHETFELEELMPYYCGQF